MKVLDLRGVLWIPIVSRLGTSDHFSINSGVHRWSGGEAEANRVDTARRVRKGASPGKPRRAAIGRGKFSFQVACWILLALGSTNVLLVLADSHHEV